MPKLSPYLTALLLAWLFALLWYLGNNPAPDWASLLPATETLTVWLWRLAAALTLAVIAALLPCRFYRRAAEVGANFFRLSRSVQVCGAFALSLLLLEGLMKLLPVLRDHWELSKQFWETGAFWTSAMLLVSAPVAFVVWRFRDENQSKDINLKEFQKISEWVTGAHFQDAKQGETLSGSLPENADAALHSFSKQDGAVGLQIAAVYNLLPFYRGDYGQAFEKPSVHLLHSAWKVLQHDILRELDKTDDKGTRYALIQKLRERADSPLGQAITRVLLACDYAKKPLLHRHLEILPGICLSGMNFNLTGLEHKILRESLFCGQDLTEAQWQGVRGIWEWNLSKAIFNGINLNGASLYKTNLTDAEIYQADLTGANLSSTNLSGAKLTWADLTGTELEVVNLTDAELNETNLTGAQLEGANLSGANLMYADLTNAMLDGVNLNGAVLNMTNLLDTKGLTAKQLAAVQMLTGSMIDADNFSQYSQPEQHQLWGKGLVVLYKGRDTVSKFLFYGHKTEKSWGRRYFTDSISFTIDLEKTRENNPDWEISIE